MCRRHACAAGTCQAEPVIPDRRRACSSPDFESQARLAWSHVMSMLEAAGMDVGDIVKLTQSLIRRSDLEAYRAIRNEHLGDARPASMLSFVSGLATPDMLIEIEVVAAR
jgi:2-iminobutanoate/2-iminopropanoate deaminase/2-aminomuconate deaminase